MEEQFYLVWPAIEKFVKATFIVPLLILLLLINQACNFGLLSSIIAGFYGTADAVYRPIFLITFTPILLGVLAAHGMHHSKTGIWITTIMRGYWVALLFLMIAIGVCEFAPVLQGLPRLLVHISFCALLVAMVVNPKNVFSTFLNARPIAYLGTISYGMYLYHVFVLFFVEKIEGIAGWQFPPSMLFIIVSAITIGIAALSFRYFERPIMRKARPVNALGVS